MCILEHLSMNITLLNFLKNTFPGNTAMKNVRNEKQKKNTFYSKGKVPFKTVYVDKFFHVRNT